MSLMRPLSRSYARRVTTPAQTVCPKYYPTSSSGFEDSISVTCVVPTEPEVPDDRLHLADRSTLFLDEVLELPLHLQAKLLRAIEQREVLPLGETKPVPVDIRVIAATQEPLSRAVADGRFRADLHARLDGLTITLPMLRERRTDVVPLLLGFISRSQRNGSVELDPKLVYALCVYDWPLNVRELSLLARRLMDVYRHEPTLRRSFLPDRILGCVRDEGKESAPAPAKRAWQSTKDDSQYEALLLALREHNGSVAKAAAAIGINRARAYRLLSTHPEDASSNSSA